MKCEAAGSHAGAEQHVSLTWVQGSGQVASLGCPRNLQGTL